MRTSGRAVGVALAALVASSAASQTRVTFDQAAPVVRALSASLPATLRGLTPDAAGRQWVAWTAAHDREVRARLARGDEDSLVNFWLYGTSFTSRPPAVATAASQRPSGLEDLARARLEDLLDGVRTPRENERLQFARQALLGRDADPATPEGRGRARRFLLDARQRMIQEFADVERTLAAARPHGDGALTAANGTIFRERGLSSDTSLLPDYGVYSAVEAMARDGTLSRGSVRRVAIVGPGLDFTNKADGYDFYPQQTLQPFAVVDALRRSHLAAADLRVTTLDVSSRVNEHLARAVSRASSGTGYVVTLALDAQESWTPAVLQYWREWGSAIGAAADAPPGPAVPVRARAVRVRPEVVSSITPLDLNIVVDRLEVSGGDRFDLVVATNVLVYYGLFEQALAAANAAAMLRPGGVLITNTAILPVPPLRDSAAYLRVAHTAERYDEIFWYRRE